MALIPISYILHNRAVISLICIIGMLAITYGIHYRANLVFSIGIGFVIVGYLLIRKRIKEHIRNGP